MSIGITFTFLVSMASESQSAQASIVTVHCDLCLFTLEYSWYYVFKALSLASLDNEKPLLDKERMSEISSVLYYYFLTTYFCVRRIW